MPHAKINYALAATLLAAGQSFEQIAPKVGAKNGNVLQAGLCRKGVNATMARSPELATGINMAMVAKVASQASELLRAELSDDLAGTVKRLRSVPMGKGLKQLKQRAELLEPLARTAKIVHDWGNETTQGIIAFGVVEQLDQAQDALEVSSSVSQTPTESVPVQEPDSSTTLDDKPQ